MFIILDVVFSIRSFASPSSMTSLSEPVSKSAKVEISLFVTGLTIFTATIGLILSSSSATVFTDAQFSHNSKLESLLDAVVGAVGGAAIPMGIGSSWFAVGAGWKDVAFMDRFDSGFLKGRPWNIVW